MGGGAHAVELQQMNQFAQTALITAIGHRTRERALEATAYGTAAETLGIAFGVHGKHALAADRTGLAANWKDACQAIEADGKARDVQQGFGADAAIGRKQDGEETLGGAMKPS